MHIKDEICYGRHLRIPWEDAAKRKAQNQSERIDEVRLKIEHPAFGDWESFDIGSNLSFDHCSIT